VLIFDPDPAGVKAALRGFDLLAGSGMKVNVVSLPDGDDPDTFLKKRGYEAFASCLKRSDKLMDFVLGQVVKDGAVAAIDEKVERAAEMLGFIAKLPSGIEQDHYLKKTAEALVVDEGLLRQEMAKRRTVHAGPRERTPGRTSALIGRRPRAEETLIHLMLRDEDLARRIAEEITPEDFTDPLLQRAYKKIKDVLARGSNLDIRALSDEGDSDLNRLFSLYSVLELDCEKQEGQERILADKERTCDDCLSTVKQADPEQKMKDIVKRIKEAEEKGDEKERCRLQAMQIELSRRPGRKIPGLK
jgi:DNA primase